MGRYTESNKYSATPRSIFDKHVDRMEIKRQRDREDHRADMQALIKRLNNLETQLMDLAEELNLARHTDLGFCPENETKCKHYTEELE